MTKEKEKIEGKASKVVANCDRLPMTAGQQPFRQEEIARLILNIRGMQVMVDRDLAVLYGVETKRLNEQVRRNIERFPERFRFQLTKEETDEVVAICDHLKALKFSKVTPYVFTEQGISMLSTAQPNGHSCQHQDYGCFCFHAPLYCDQCPIIPKA